MQDLDEIRDLSFVDACVVEEHSTEPVPDDAQLINTTSVTLLLNNECFVAQVASELVERLTQISHLDSITVIGNVIDDEIANTFAPLTKIACLVFRDTAVTSAAVNELQRAMVNTDIVAIKSDPDDDFFFELEGNCFDDDDGLHDGVNIWSHAIKLSPSGAGAYYMRANCYQELGEHVLALKDYTRAYENGFSDSQVLCDMGQCYMSMGNHFEAQKLYQSVLKDYPDDPNALFGNGMMKIVNGLLTLQNHLLLRNWRTWDTLRSLQ